ncbi:hypothetical protein LOTGIDRAFT_129554, partial [Lottia gigantea]
RFSINFTSHPDTDLKDTALHFNPRFDEGCIVRNSKQHGGWGSEERHAGLPLQKGTPFEIVFDVHPHNYKIHINGRHFCDFHHRLPKQSVNYLVIYGDVEISFIKFEGQKFNAICSYLFQAVPLTTGIPGQLSPGRMIHVSGVPYSNPSRMTFNLMCGSDKALHFDVRFNYGDSRNVCVRTHCQNGNYGPEERQHSFFPFMPNASFDLLILVEPSCYKIAVNNQHFIEFHHRIPYQNVTTLNIEGDVRLTQVRFQ